MQTHPKKYENTISKHKREWVLALCLGLSLGIGEMYSFYFPKAFQALPFTFFSSVALWFYLKEFKSLKNINKPLLGLLLWGSILAVVRYSSFYSESHSFFPVIRQALSFSIGIWLLLSFRLIIRHINFSLLGLCISLSSLPFLILGTVQFIQNYSIGSFPRVVSTFSEPSHYGNYLTLVLAPCLLVCIHNFKHFSSRIKVLVAACLALWIWNVYITQSGTALLKLLSLSICILFMYPIKLKVKLLLISFFTLVLSVSLFLENSYVLHVSKVAYKIVNDPDLFFEHHNFYDRFYPVWPALKSLFSLPGFFGLGFGADYFEFENLYPVQIHEDMIASKPTLSFFNGFTPKIILYFGVAGFIWFLSLLRLVTRGKNNNIFVSVGLLNVLISAFWSIPNFSLPYIWFWLALRKNEEEGTSKGF